MRRPPRHLKPRNELIGHIVDTSKKYPGSFAVYKLITNLNTGGTMGHVIKKYDNLPKAEAEKISVQLNQKLYPARPDLW